MAKKYLDSNGLGTLWGKIKNRFEKDYNRTVSRAEQLVTNGSGLMGDNTNFSMWTFDGKEAFNSSGSFTKEQSTSRPTLITDDFFPTNPDNLYELSVTAKSLNGLSTLYAMPVFYDADKYEIAAHQHMYMPNTLTTLARDLKNGDTVVYLTDLTNWNVDTSSRSYQRGFIFWNYKNSFGYEYPENTYSRNVWYNLYEDTNVNKTTKTITLNSAWNHQTIPAGTKVSQSSSGSTYKYVAWTGTRVTQEWVQRKGTIGEVDYSGQNVTKNFPPASAYCKIGFLWNYNQANDQIWITNISFKVIINVNNTSGVLPIINGGTGKTSGRNAANYFMNALDTGSSTPADADYYISQYVNGGTTTTTYHRRPMSALWEYIKSKISSVLGLTATTYGGSAAKVNNHTVNSDVPSNAVFTDTVTTATTTGSGNAVTAITASNGALTVTKGTTFLTQHQDISGKADKSATVSTVSYDSTNKKITKTINGTTSDVVTTATLKTAMGLDNAEANQNAFSNVKIGSTTISADSKTDILELAAGNNITLTPDATNDKITIAATDTTYESKTAAENGTALSLVTTGEKYLWNNAASGTGSASWDNISGKPTETEENTTGISIGNHATGTVIGVQSSTTSVTGVQSSTTTASKVTLGTALSIPNVTGASNVTVPKAATSATTVPIKNATATSIPNVTDVGSASNWVFENITVPIKATSATTVPIAASSATTVPIKDASATTIPNVTNAGSGSASLTFTMDSTDTKKLIISFSHTHTPPTIGTPISVTGVQSTTTSVTGINGSTSVTGVQSSTTTASHVKSGGNGTAPTLGTAISIYGVQSSTTSVTGVSGSTTASKVTLGTAISVPNVTNVSDVTVPIKATSATTVPIKNTSASTFVTGTTHTITDNGHTHSIS